MDKHVLTKKYQELFGTEKSAMEIMRETDGFLSIYKDKTIKISELLYEGAIEEIRLIVENYKKYSELDEMLLCGDTNSLVIFGDFASVNYRELVSYLDLFETYIETVMKEIHPTIKDKVFQEPPRLFYLSRMESINSESVLIEKTIESVDDIFNIQKQDSNYTLYRIEKGYSYIGIKHKGYEFVFRGDFNGNVTTPSVKIMTLFLKMWVEENLSNITAQGKEYRSFESHFELKQTDIFLKPLWHTNAGQFFKNESQVMFDFSAELVREASRKCANANDLKLLKEITGKEEDVEPALDEHFKVYWSNCDNEKKALIELIQVKTWRNLSLNQKRINEFVETNWFKDVLNKGSFHRHNDLVTTAINYNMVGTVEELEYYKQHLKFELRSDLKIDLFMLLKTIKHIEFLIYGENPITLPTNVSEEIPRLLKLFGNIKNLSTPSLIDSGWSIFYVKGNENINKILNKWCDTSSHLSEAVIALPIKKINAKALDIKTLKHIVSGYADNLLVVAPSKKGGLSLVVDDSYKDYTLSVDTRIDLEAMGSVARVTKIYSHANSGYTLVVDNLRSLDYIDIDLPKQTKLCGTLKLDLDVLDMIYYCLFGEHFMEIEDTFFIFPSDIEKYVFNGHRGLFDKEWYTAAVKPRDFTRILTQYFFIDGKLVPFHPENNEVILEYLGNSIKKPTFYHEMGVSTFLQVNTEDVKLLKTDNHQIYKCAKLLKFHSEQERVKLASQRFLSADDIRNNNDTEVVYTLKLPKYRHEIPAKDKENAGMLGTIISTGKTIKILTEFGDVLEFSVGSIKNTGWVHLSTVNPQIDILNHFTTAEKIQKREKGFKLFIKYNQDLIGSDDLLKIE